MLFKVKELWFYQIHLFEHGEKYGKKIKKAQNLAAYLDSVRELVGSCRIHRRGDWGQNKSCVFSKVCYNRGKE